MEDRLLLDWMKEVNREFQLTREQMVAQHKELQAEISKNGRELQDDIARNREEFVIFKTKVNTRTALISATAGFIAVLLSIILNIGGIKERFDARKTDHAIENVNDLQ